MALSSVSFLSAAQIGDSLEKVLAEKGKPTSEMSVGSAKVLNYTDQTIKLKEGKVVEINEAVRVAPTPPPSKNTIAIGSWTVDFRQAMLQAQQQDRRVFLFFTGTDWSTFSQRFYHETLTSREFALYAIDKLILVQVDFPKKTEQSEALKKQNQALMKAFEVERLPTVVVLDKTGKVMGKIPYEEGGTPKFMAALKKL